MYARSTCARHTPWLLRWGRLFGGAAALLLCVASAANAGAEEAGLRGFVRAVEAEPQHVQLEVAIRRYESAAADRPAIDLVGVIHIADADYYGALQRHLDRQPLVLFEGIGKPPFVTDREEDDRRRALRTRHAIGFLADRLTGYRQRHGTYPGDLDTLLADTAEHAPGEARWTRAATRDHWDRPLHYTPHDDDEGYTLKSFGADGEPGGEGVDAEIAFTPVRDADAAADAGRHDQLQSGVAAALGLTFQLDAMNYDRPHFRHSDMSVRELGIALAARSEGEVPDLQQRRPDPPPGLDGVGLGEHTEGLDDLVRLLDGTRFTRAVMGFAERLLVNHPGLRQLSRLVLIDVLGQIEGDLAAMPGLTPDMQQLMQVLIVDRNRVVVEDVRKLLEDDVPHESISIFYGAGHMPDLAKQLSEELDYEPTDRVEWHTAFTADLRDAELQPEQVELIRGLIRFQLRTLNR